MLRGQRNPRTSFRRDRERDCRRGGSSKKIANQLGLSPYTVDQYINSAMRKLHAASRAEAVAKAYALGFVT